MISRDFAQKRARILSLLRLFFAERDFLEVDTPILVKLPGMEPYLDPFQTEFVDMKGERSPMYLITSPEYAMKRLLAAHYERIFQLGKCFRNKETGGRLHNPEFTLLEWYRAHSDYFDIMSDLESLFRFLVPDGNFVYQGMNIDVTKFERLKVVEAFEKYAGIDREVFENVDLLRIEVKKRGYALSNDASYDDVFFCIFLNEIEPKLGIRCPVILYEYPASMASLSRLSQENPKYAERFELYIAGIELANAFSELNDGSEQKSRFQDEQMLRRKLGKHVYDLDEKFLEAVGKMPPSSGIALGVDRLIMLLVNAESIGDVMFFPFVDL